LKKTEQKVRQTLRIALIPTILFGLLVCLSFTSAVVPTAGNASVHMSGNMPGELTNEQINWLTFEEALEQSKIEPRKILVNVSTQWCPACRKMDQTTFRNKALVDYISNRFYAVKFDAGSNEEVELMGETYRKEGRIHHMAMFLSRRGNLVFPTYSIMDEDFQNPQPAYGYQDPETMDKFLTYFGENHHESIEWEIFESSYQYQEKK